MSDLWKGAYTIDRALVEALIGEQFPHLPTDGLEHVGAGWDHEVWRCGDVVFRFPHQDSSLRSAHDGSEALAQLAPCLALAVPEPILQGHPTPDYPGHAVGYRWIDGALPARRSLTEEQRARAADPLAGFLVALHGVPREHATAWGIEPEGPRGTMAERSVYGAERAEQLADTPFGPLAAEAARAMADPPPECHPDERRVVHGDLHAGQVLFDDSHRLVGVIDWDSLAWGDPAFDLLMVYGFLPPASRASFWAAYGDRGPARRAWHLALSYGLALVAQGVSTGDDGVRDEAVFALRNALDGDANGRP